MMNLPIPFLKTEEDVYYKADTIMKRVLYLLEMNSVYYDDKKVARSCCAAGTGRPLAN